MRSRQEDKRFARITDFVLKWETVFKKGHYGDYAFAIVETDSNDAGNYVKGKLVGTKFGIDSRSHPNVDLAKLDVEGARDIYFEEYWVKYGCDKLAEPLGEVFYNAAINAGIGRAKTLLAASKRDAGAFLREQEAFYRRLAEQKPKVRVYLRGWLNRCAALRKFLALT